MDLIGSGSPVSVIPVAQHTVEWQSLNANVGPAPLVLSRSLSGLGVNPDDPVALAGAILSMHNRLKALNDPMQCSDALKHGSLAFLVLTGATSPDYTIFEVHKSLVYKDEESHHYLMSGSPFQWYLTTLMGSNPQAEYGTRLTANLIHAFMLRTGLRKLYGDCTRIPLGDGTYTIERS